MGKIKRYDPDCEVTTQAFLGMEEATEGEYVLYSDYKAKVDYLIGLYDVADMRAKLDKAIWVIEMAKTCLSGGSKSITPVTDAILYDKLSETLTEITKGSE